MVERRARLTQMDIGVPELCPTCGCQAWEIFGQLPYGVTTVKCPACWRTYVRMDRYAEIVYVAGVLASYAGDRSYPQLVPWYRRLMSLMDFVSVATGAVYQMVCTVEGNPDNESDDDLPF